MAHDIRIPSTLQQSELQTQVCRLHLSCQKKSTLTAMPFLWHRTTTNYTVRSWFYGIGTWAQMMINAHLLYNWNDRIEYRVKDRVFVITLLISYCLYYTLCILHPDEKPPHKNLTDFLTFPFINTLTKLHREIAGFNGMPLGMNHGRGKLLLLEGDDKYHLFVS